MIPNGHRVHAPRRIVRGQWDDAVDDRFIDLLIDERLNGRFGRDNNNIDAVTAAMNGINREFNRDFPLEQCQMRVHFLRRRFNFFSSIYNYSGVAYDQASGRFDIDPHTMSQLREVTNTLTN